MTLVLRTTFTTTVRRTRAPIVLAPTNDAGPRVIVNAERYQSISSLQALALAIAASVATPALLWLVL